MQHRHIESDLQKACVKWFRLQYPNYSTLLFSVPNGGMRNTLEAMKMKKEGMTAGVSDLILLLPRGHFHALCIEMKTMAGRQTDYQKQWQQAVEAAGYRYEVCRSFLAFQSLINEYLGVKRL